MTRKDGDMLKCALRLAELPPSPPWMMGLVDVLEVLIDDAVMSSAERMDLLLRVQRLENDRAQR